MNDGTSTPVTPLEALAHLAMILAISARPTHRSAVVYRMTTSGSVEQNRALRARLRMDGGR